MAQLKRKKSKKTLHLYQEFLRDGLASIRAKRPKIPHNEAMKIVAELWHNSSINPNKGQPRKVKKSKKEIIDDIDDEILKSTEPDLDQVETTFEIQEVEIKEVEVDNDSETDCVVFKLNNRSELKVVPYEIFNNIKMVETCITTDANVIIEEREVIEEIDEDEQEIKEITRILRNFNMIP